MAGINGDVNRLMQMYPEVMRPPQAQPMFQPMVSPMQPTINPMSFGAARFLQGNMQPMVLNFAPPPMPEYNIPRYTPGNFQDYLASIAPPPETFSNGNEGGE